MRSQSDGEKRTVGIATICIRFGSRWSQVTIVCFATRINGALWNVDTGTLGQQFGTEEFEILGVFPTKQKGASVCSLDVLFGRASDESRMGNRLRIDGQGAMTNIEHDFR
jgi:hypothetical protein